jgi:hypothetical protein
LNENLIVFENRQINLGVSVHVYATNEPLSHKGRIEYTFPD